jgi:outer membrane lipoprotein-sorting protein
MKTTDRTSVLALLLGLLGLLGSAPAWAFDLDALTAVLATRKAAEARFTEERFVSGFDGPLRASGTLVFKAPDSFARHTAEPRPESMIVEGNTVILKRGGRSRQMALDAVPELTALIEAVRGTLRGDAATLRRHFETRVEGAAGLWTLTLKPKDERLAAQVREVKITGQQSALRSVELWLAGGDRSLMSIDLPK